MDLDPITLEIKEEISAALEEAAEAHGREESYVYDIWIDKESRIDKRGVVIEIRQTYVRVSFNFKKGIGRSTIQYVESSARRFGGTTTTENGFGIEIRVRPPAPPPEE